MPFEQHRIPQGKILIAFSDKRLSIGTLHINPREELPKHNRPVLESLLQIKGSCVMKLFEEDGSITEVVINEGDSIDVMANKFHIHSNPTGEISVTLWKASGDITNIIEDIRKNGEM